MASWVTISIAAVAGALLLMLWLGRRYFEEVAKQPVILTKRHLALYSALIGFAVAMSIIVGAVGRAELRTEREARVDADIQSLSDRTLTREQVAELARVQARLLQPTRREQLQRINMALKTCAGSRSCRVAFVRTVNRIVRSPKGRLFTPAPPKGVPPTPPPTGAVIIPPAPQGAPAPPRPPRPDPRVDGLQRDLSVLRRAITDLQSRKQDSSVVNGLDNRLADVERGLQGLIGRVDVLQRVVNAVCRLLTPGRCG